VIVSQPTRRLDGRRAFHPAGYPLLEVGRRLAWRQPLDGELVQLRPVILHANDVRACRQRR